MTCATVVFTDVIAQEDIAPGGTGCIPAYVLLEELLTEDGLPLETEGGDEITVES